MLEDGNVYIGSKITEAREKRGWNQGALAAQLQDAGLAWHQTTVSKVERGERPVRAVELPTLALVLGRDPFDFLPGGRLGQLINEAEYGIGSARIEAASGARGYLRAVAVRDAVVMLSTLSGDGGARFAVDSDPFQFAGFLTRDVETAARRGGWRGLWPEVLGMLDTRLAERAAALAEDLRQGRPVECPESVQWLIDDLSADFPGAEPVTDEDFNAVATQVAIGQMFPDVYPGVEFNADVTADPDSMWARAVELLNADDAGGWGIEDLPIIVAREGGAS
ncbi:helix-turn-helix domain-containing protein [Micrococcus luteus]|uniref:helix-turn-helix domain-containing protein n=1 Tax=Micrococcus luteus TaxID=1270 RepID=UPI003EB8A60F